MIRTSLNWQCGHQNWSYTAITARTAVLWVGIGCTSGASSALIKFALNTVCQQYRLDLATIAGIATLDRKTQETGLLALAQQWPLHFFSAADLNPCLVPHPSAAVNAAVGTPSVAEAAALTAARGTSPLAHEALLVVPKQSFRLLNQTGAVTLAIAQPHTEKTASATTEPILAQNDNATWRQR